MVRVETVLTKEDWRRGKRDFYFILSITTIALLVASILYFSIVS